MRLSFLGSRDPVDSPPATEPWLFDMHAALGALSEALSADVVVSWPRMAGHEEVTFTVEWVPGDQDERLQIKRPARRSAEVPNVQFEASLAKYMARPAVLSAFRLWTDVLVAVASRDPGVVFELAPPDSTPGVTRTPTNPCH